ncbi:MAG TPA: hypothetical protein VM869_03750 [Enhygromyxa sp.]|nr:hypothetical protein [Enhygromyxa sp.]
MEELLVVELLDVVPVPELEPPESLEVEVEVEVELELLAESDFAGVSAPPPGLLLE